MRVAPLEGYRLWASQYDAAPNPLLALEQRTVESVLASAPPGRVVDVGCGTGRWARILGARPDAYIGVDLCEAMLREAPASVRPRLAVGDAARLPLASAVAGVTLCALAVGYFPDLPEVFREFARVTRPGGSVVVSELHPEAVAAGWMRSFRHQDTVYEIEYHAHSMFDLLCCGAEAGLTFQGERVACFGEAEREIFRAARRDHLFAAVSQVPAVWAGVWVRQ